MEDDIFVKIALGVAQNILRPPYFIKRGSSLLYQITVDNKLDIVVNPKKPKRGQSAFETDLCIYEKVNNYIEIPRVVLEFKKGLSTHDVLIYSSKASKHKEIYPYLRYGLIIGNENKIPGKFFTHNRALDFCVAAKTYKENELEAMLSKLFKAEIKSSRLLESIVFEKLAATIFRNNIETILNRN